MDRTDGGVEGRARQAHLHRTGHPKSLHLGGRRQRVPATAPAAEKETPGVFFRLMAKRPSDRRSPGRNPGPQGAFEVSMINVSCNSH